MEEGAREIHKVVDSIELAILKPLVYALFWVVMLAEGRLVVQLVLILIIRIEFVLLN